MLTRTRRRTKIVCTIGPASQSPAMIAALIDAGMNVARMNFSHGTHEEHREVVARIRQIAAEKGTPVAILQDLAGPKIRVGSMRQPVELTRGAEFSIYKAERVGDKDAVSCSFPGIVDAVSEGDTILLADGTIEIVVEKKAADAIRCRVVVGGVLSSHKGINIPGRSLQLPGLTEKDKIDLAFGIEIGVNWIALSFVRKPGDVLKIKSILHRAGVDIPVIAKIEKHEALTAIDEIISVSDGIMVARGDLAVETGLERMPMVQKTIIVKCNQQGKPVITATQMLMSMVEHNRPTRAESTDVANAVLDGTDAVMLSDETAIGKYPVETVVTMDKILVATEQECEWRRELHSEQNDGAVSVPAAVSHAAVMMAGELSAAAIVTPTNSGSTARMVARYRPQRPIVALCTREEIQLQLCLIWGVYPLLVAEQFDTDAILQMAKEKVGQSGLAKPGDRIIITAGLPPGQKGTTNLIKVEEIDA